jgi:hypothetical protein
VLRIRERRIRQMHYARTLFPPKKCTKKVKNNRWILQKQTSLPFINHEFNMATGSFSFFFFWELYDSKTCVVELSEDKCLFFALCITHVSFLVWSLCSLRAKNHSLCIVNFFCEFCKVKVNISLIWRILHAADQQSVPVSAISYLNRLWISIYSGSATRYTTHLSSTVLSTVLCDPLLVW